MKTANHVTDSDSSAHQHTNDSGSLTWLSKQARNFEKARFGWMAMLITAQSCMGSVACGFILKNNASIIMLCICAGITMGTNALLIALAPPKVCLIAFYVSMIFNTFFILANI